MGKQEQQTAVTFISNGTRGLLVSLERERSAKLICRLFYPTERLTNRPIEPAAI